MSKIIATAIEAGNFTTLVNAIQAADLVGTLDGDGPFTVFAPNDAAFAKLPSGTVEELLKDKEKLAKILTYHVVSGKVLAEDVATMTTATTVEGSDLKVSMDGSDVKINDAKVLKADIDCDNGVIHVIDSVLMPN